MRAAAVVCRPGRQLVALGDAEAVLLVDDDDRQVREAYVALDEGVRADDHLGLAGGDAGEGVAALGGGQARGQ